MTLDKLRNLLTNHIERVMFTYHNEKLLIHPSVKENADFNDLLNRIKDDIELMPEIEKTIDGTEIKFYVYDYKNLYYQSELLAIIFASINQDWNIIKGFDINKGRIHYYLKSNNIIYDPSLSIITTEDIYSKKFKQLKEIKNEDVLNYLRENNNLWKFYHKGILKKDPDFSINFINRIKDKLNKNINAQYILDDNRIKEIKDWIIHDDFIPLRQILTKKRISYLQSNKIAVHPSIDKKYLEIIEKAAKNIKELMKDEYDKYIDYYNNTLGSCYALSILLNLYDGNFKLIQGGIPYKSVYYLEKPNRFYQHSWLEIDDYVYDPALRIITTKELYYMFVQKEDEYSKEETENILRRIGFNFTHFKDFLSGIQIGGDETVLYRLSVKDIDSEENKEEGEKLISKVRSLKR